MPLLNNVPYKTFMQVQLEFTQFITRVFLAVAILLAVAAAVEDRCEVQDNCLGMISAPCQSFRPVFIRFSPLK